MSCGIYLAVYALRKRKGFSFLLFAGLFIIVEIVCNIIGSPYRSPSYWEFFFRTSDFFRWDYAIMSIVLFSFIIGFITAYFSVHQPKANFLLLSAFIPLILAARTQGGLPLGIMVYLAVTYLAAMLGVARPEYPSEYRYVDDKKSHRERLYATGLLCVISAVMLIILPRLTETPFMSYVDNVLVKRSSIYGRSGLTNFMTNSIPNRGASKPSDDVLFTVVTRAPQTISRWSFDDYEGGDKGWAYNDNFNTGTKFWQNHRPLVNAEELAEDLKTGAKHGHLEEYKDELMALEYSFPKSGEMTIQVRDGSQTAVVMHPTGTYRVVFPKGEQNTYRNPKDEIFTKENMEKNPLYSLRYYIDEPNESLMALFEEVDFRELLSDALEEDVISKEKYDAFMEEYNSAYEYLETTYKVSPAVEQLAKEITAGLDTDYEKARAIEKWFKDAGYVYDMDFVPAEMTVEYFLFESKRGICTDFATATTQLLRAVGIPARYTEGFVLSDDILDTYGRFNVTPAQAHAYSTAYIDGAGWIEIDGTKYANPAQEGELLRIILIIIVCIGLVLLIVGIIFREQLSELIFSIRFKAANKEKRIREVYLRTRRLACEIAGVPQKSATAEEVQDILARMLGMKVEAMQIAMAANYLLYAPEADVSGIDEKQLYENYKKLRNMKKEKKIK